MKCGGCLQEFCFNHWGDHRQELSKHLDKIEVSRDLFRQTLTEQTTDQQKHALTLYPRMSMSTDINIITIKQN